MRLRVASARAAAQVTPITPPPEFVDVVPSRHVRIELLAIAMSPWMLADVLSAGARCADATEIDDAHTSATAHHDHSPIRDT
jgi:hypothetical protein